MVDKTIVYILGAGASAEDGAPLTRNLIAHTCREFWSRLLTKSNLQKFEPVLNLMDKWYETHLERAMVDAYKTGTLGGTWINDANRIDVEEFLTRIENKVKDKSSEFKKLKKLAHYFIFHPLCYKTNLIAQHELKHYTAFVEKVLKRDARHCIITFNYDTLLERAMFDPDRYLNNDYRNPIFNRHYSNGQRLPWTYAVNFNNVFWTSVPYRVEDESIAEIFLLKLHGSFNWGLCSETKEIMMHPPVADAYQYERFYYGQNPCHAAKHNQKPLLIPPTREKYLIPALKQVWEKARSFLRQATELHIIGYSAPEADEDAIKLIQKELKPRINELEKVVLANRSANTRIKDLLSITDTGCEKYDTYDTFEEYLEREFNAK